MEKEVKPQPTMAEIAVLLREKFADAVCEQANSADPEQVVGAVIKDLNAAKNVVTMKILGLDNKWGNWKVDHCNGRDSIAKNCIDDASVKLIRDWVNEAVREVLTEAEHKKFVAKCKAAIKKEIIDRMAHGNESYKYASNICDQVMQQAAQELREELGIVPTTK